MMRSHRQELMRYDRIICRIKTGDQATASMSACYVYDRLHRLSSVILLSDWQPSKIAILDQNPTEVTVMLPSPVTRKPEPVVAKLHPSDHFGLSASFELAPIRQAQA